MSELNNQSFESEKDIQIKKLQEELEKTNQRLSDLYTKYGIMIGEKDTNELQLNLKNKESIFYHNFSLHLYNILKDFSPEDTDIAFEDLFLSEIKNFIKHNIRKNQNPTTIEDRELFCKIENTIIKTYNIEQMKDYFNHDFM
jgi:hypothetical protein